MRKELRECPKCGRQAEALTDQEELMMREGKLEVVSVEGDEPCGRCEEGVENRDELL